ncbi:hypothetical protein VNI00_006246 [Paramarasmius palmivorus]|uniref:ubiquitinyl hydrolase 1 n=1 Tax=Paramarasmius palmivorus TaxID=297713 RepID=A0AAW0D5P1_9AGAR
MPKPKQPTPQELYRARKAQEEAYLPPGLLNHGNTCFMNSVLQGLIATKTLHGAVLNSGPSGSSQGQGNGGQEGAGDAEGRVTRSRIPPILTPHEGFPTPISDAFLNFMVRAWDVQSTRRRESLSPRFLLTTLGRKYDQYLDFAQQDAHEFLRILLDAMRMEEVDIIKKRHPRQRPLRRQGTLKPLPAPSLQPQTSPIQAQDEEPPIPLPDTLFSGILTSILVCQKCKHISQTYEDFSDLSLSLKPEENRVGRRERFRRLVGKVSAMGAMGKSKPNGKEKEKEPRRSDTIKPAPPAPAPLQPPPTPSALQIVRSSSVPPSPHPNTLEPVSEDGGRRRSWDAAPLSPSPPSGLHSEDEDAVLVPHPDSNSSPHPHVEFVTTTTMDSSSSSQAKEKERSLNWGEKLGRRISSSMGLSRSGSLKAKKRRSRSGSVANAQPMPTPNTDAVIDISPLSTLTTTTSIESTGTPEIRLISPGGEDGDATVRPRSATTSQQPQVGSAGEDGVKMDPKPKKPRPKSLSPAPSYPAPVPGPRTALPLTNGVKGGEVKEEIHVKRSKSPKPPKPTRKETAFLREVMADHPSHSSHSHHSQWGDMKNWGDVRNWTSGSNGSIGGVSVEDCLRMFTAVEVLDGENMVGCRRCWKVREGWYQDSDSSSDDSEDEGEREGVDVDATPVPNPQMTPQIPSPRPTPQISTSTYLPHSVSSPVLASPVQAQELDYDLHPVPPLPILRSFSSHSLPPTSPVDGEVTARPGFSFPGTGNSSTDVLYDARNGAGDSSSLLSVPSISRSRKSSLTDEESSVVLSSTEDEVSDSSGASDDEDGDESTQATTPNPSISHPSLPQQPPAATNSPNPQKSKKPKKPKPTLLRPAYKRYLIHTPPPVLVIHLKRFQQTASSPFAMSFGAGFGGSGFKKLDDYVRFPEYLDLRGYLAPKREEFGLPVKGAVKSGEGSGSGKKEKGKDKEKCMYRLYAVVVHIGNMLGGHYVAYTALPSPPAPSEGGEKKGEKEKEERQWAYISDTTVRLTTLEEVLKTKAYICLYERVS